MVKESDSKFVDLALRLPDIPRWVDVRGMLFTGRCEVYGLKNDNPSDFVVRGCDYSLICVVGEPAHSDIHEAISQNDASVEILANPENFDYVAATLENWQNNLALIHQLTRPIDGIEVIDNQVRFISEKELNSVRNDDPELVDELLKVFSYSPIVATMHNNKPVSFCYAAAETETIWDISIDTLPQFRRKGFAQNCVKFMIQHMLKKGKQPIWGALESNLASLNLAEKFGFTIVERLYLFTKKDRVV